MAKKGKYIGIAGTLLVYMAIIALLVSVSFTAPKQEEESDVTLMVDDGGSAYGGFNPKTLVDVDILPGETPAISSVNEKEEVKEAEEALELIEQKQKERTTAEAVAKQVAGAFGKSAQPENQTTETGAENNKTNGTSNGASSNTVQGYGTFDLSGRSIGEEGLPRPQYNVQEEGKVVVTITVNPAGFVVGAGINRQTNTVNPILRKAAEEAARKARFNEVEGVTNQTGTIIYYFNLR
jgi:TonB family protein